MLLWLAWYLHDSGFWEAIKAAKQDELLDLRAYRVFNLHKGLFDIDCLYVKLHHIFSVLLTDKMTFTAGSKYWKTLKKFFFTYYNEHLCFP